MAKLVSLSIDLMKIDKSRIIEGKNGAKYVNVTLSLNDEKDRFDNDVSCWQGQTQEERQQKAQRNFLGNGKTVWSNEGQYNQMQQNSGAMPPPPPPAGLPVEDELPF